MTKGLKQWFVERKNEITPEQTIRIPLAFLIIVKQKESKFITELAYNRDSSLLRLVTMFEKIQALMRFKRMTSAIPVQYSPN